MTTNLRNLEITEGSLVDKGANQHAAVMLFKNHSDSERGDYMNDIDKAGAKLSARSKGIIRQAIDALRGVDGLEDLETTEKKGDSMSENVEDMQKRINELQAEADKVTDLTAQVDELTKQLAEVNTEEVEEDVLKGAPEEVQKAMAEMRKELDEAKAEASAANEAVLAKKYEDMAGGLDNLGDVAKTASMLRKAHDAGFGDELVEALNSASAIVKANGTIMKEIGSDSESEDNPDAKLDKLAKAYASEHDVTYAQAMVATITSDEGRKIHSERGDI